MHIPFLVLTSLMGCSERVVIPGRATPSGRAWLEWQSLLEDATHDEGVDYELIDDNRYELEAFLRWAGQPWRKRCEDRSCRWVKRNDDGPGGSHFDESDEDLALTYYINFFNAAAIYSIIEERPAQSIDEIEGGLAFWSGGGFWWGRQFRLDEEWVNLYYLHEQQIINRFQSPFPLIALNPGIAGGPPVRWWEPSNWDTRRLRTRHSVSVPRLGEDIDEAEFLGFFVEGGDWVDDGQAIGELQTPETTIVVRANRSGFITTRHAEIGQIVGTGETLVDIYLSPLETRFRESWTQWIDSDGAVRRTDSGWAINASFLDWEDEIADWTDSENLCAWIADRASEPERQSWLRERIENCVLETFETDRTLNAISEPYAPTDD